MGIIRLEEDFGEAVASAAEVLRRGGIIVYPTDTIYGLGADAFSDAAVDAVYALKGREPGKPMHCVVSDLAMAAEYAEINDAARIIAEKFLPGALTLILKKKAGVEGGIARQMDTIGIRIPNNEFCIELAKTFGKPYTATSANRAGEEPARTFDEVVSHVAADLAIDAGNAPRTRPSTVVDLASGHPVILREGAIPAAEIVALF